MLRTLFLVLTLSVLLIGCNQETQNPPAPTPPEKLIWVFSQFNVPEEDQAMESYWYYGRMSETLYKAIYANEVDKGFLRLTDVHYWSDNAVHPYEDDTYQGEMLFKIEDLRKINVVKRLPVVEEQHELTVEGMEETLD
ncbi:hypothetical protein DRW07_14930 [Alteromonas sediminis]|uniref:Uncharacterized protein n=1 Tax=Alteromonas sediminis TaxID=2259342 RepID=A0A3N5XZC2_9ALTE|nr:hypothetical protein [Alteromonas sediminis]RPJ66090.1 hypothetical protein DRW07_14930 [Alteromonas sediminis]